MALVLTARFSEVKVNGNTVEGLQTIEYASIKDRKQIGAIGTDERVAVYFGTKSVVGKLRIASANADLDKLLAENTEFSVTATLRHGTDTARQVAFDQCYMDDKSFAMSTAGHGETVYTFTATRVREES